MCTQCVKEGVEAPYIGDTELRSNSISRAITEIIFGGSSMLITLECGHVYNRSHHAHGVDVELVKI